MKVALDGAVVEPGDGKPAIGGEALADLARAYVTANNVVERLGNWMDIEALRAIANGLTLNLDTLAEAEVSAAALKAALHNAEVSAEHDAMARRASMSIQ